VVSTGFVDFAVKDASVVNNEVGPD